MKTGFQLLITIGILISMVACQDSTKKEVIPNPKTTPTNITMADLKARKLPKDSVSTWIQRWKNKSTKYMSNHSIEYFDMPMEDLRAVTSQSEKNVRYYMGLENRTKTGEGLVPHLILVELSDSNVVNFDEAYDYSRVCPPLCDLIPAN